MSESGDLSEYISEGLGYLSNTEAGSELLRRGRRSIQDSINQGLREMDMFKGSWSNATEGSDSKNNSRGLPNTERNEERKQRRDNRGSFTRNIQEIIGAHGVAGVKAVTDQLGDIIKQMGLEPPETLTVTSGIESIKQGLERSGKSSGAGLLDSIRQRMQMSSDNMRIPNLREISDELSSYGQSLQDNDGDGDIDAQDLAISQQGDRLVTEMRLLHPLIAKAQRDPNFMRRKISNKKINKEQINKQENQVNLVQQGFAGHVQDVNMFEVSF